MSVIRPPDIAELLRFAGLSDAECKAVHDEAYRLMVDGRSMGVGEEEHEAGVKTVFVLDVLGAGYTVARNAGAYLLVGPAQEFIAVSRRFDDILEAVRNSFRTSAAQD